MIFKVEVIEDFDVPLNRPIGGQKFDRNFNCQNLGLMLIVFPTVVSHLAMVVRLCTDDPKDL